MFYLLIKTLITVFIVVLVSEVAKKSSLFAGLIVSIPFTTFLALVWLYWDTSDNQKIIDLSSSTLLMTIPSLTFFIFLPVLIKFNISFYLSITLAILLTAVCYWVFTLFLEKIGYSIF